MRVLRIVDDQVSSPTWARTLAEATAQIIAQGRNEPVGFIKGKTGLFHLSGGGSCSRFDWAKKTLYLISKESIQLERASSTEFTMLVQRPHYSVLDCEKVIRSFMFQLPDWKSSLELMMATDA